MRRKIIAFVGAGCVGKSTLLESLRSRLEGDDRIEIVREAAKQFFASHEVSDGARFTAEVQGEIQRIALVSERNACAQADLVITDRSALDYAVYVGAIGDPDGEAILFARARPWIPMYRRLYLLDPEGIPFENTAERRENEEMRGQLHDAFVRFFTRHSIEFILLSGSVEARMSAVESEIQDALAVRD